MLDIFYVVVVIVFFALMWGFTRAAERPLRRSHGIRNCRNRLPYFCSSI